MNAKKYTFPSARAKRRTIGGEEILKTNRTVSTSPPFAGIILRAWSIPRGFVTWDSRRGGQGWKDSRKGADTLTDSDKWTERWTIRALLFRIPPLPFSFLSFFLFPSVIFPTNFLSDPVTRVIYCRSPRENSIARRQWRRRLIITRGNGEDGGGEERTRRIPVVRSRGDWKIRLPCVLLDFMLLHVEWKIRKVLRSCR